MRVRTLAVKKKISQIYPCLKISIFEEFLPRYTAKVSSQKIYFDLADFSDSKNSGGLVPNNSSGRLS